MDIRQNTEDPIRVYDDLDFVSKQDVPDATSNLAAYSIRGPRNYVVGIEEGTPLAPEFRDVNGDKLDPSTQIILQKADVQGNPIGSAIIFEDSLDGFDYEKMRSDPQYFRYTNKPLLLKEREYLYVFVDIPQGSNDFDASESRLTIGDNTTQTGKPAFIRHVETMSQQERQMVDNA